MFETSRIWDVLDLKPRSPEKGPGRGGGNAACHIEAGVCVNLSGTSQDCKWKAFSLLWWDKSHTQRHRHTHTLIKHYKDQKPSWGRWGNPVLLLRWDPLQALESFEEKTPEWREQAGQGRRAGAEPTLTSHCCHPLSRNITYVIYFLKICYEGRKLFSKICYVLSDHTLRNWWLW